MQAVKQSTLIFCKNRVLKIFSAFFDQKTTQKDLYHSFKFGITLLIRPLKKKFMLRGS